MILSRFSRHRDVRSANRRHDNRRRFLLEPLEGRQLLSTFTVTNIDDTGSGSFREAITSSNASTGSTVNSIGYGILVTGSTTNTFTNNAVSHNGLGGVKD